MLTGLLAMLTFLVALVVLAFSRSMALFAGLMIAGFAVFGIDRFLSPFFQGNAFLPDRFPLRGQGFIVQITFTPRRYGGVEGLLEDADDFGVFSVQGDCVVFQGDSTHLSVHKNDLAAISFQNAGWRAFWMMGDSVSFTLKAPVSGIAQFVVHTREGNTILKARSINRAFCDYLKSAFYPPGNTY